MGQAEELCRRALAMAEAASTSRLAAHARVKLARVLEAAGDADTAETLDRRVGDHTTAQELQARAAAMAERDRASPDPLQAAAVAT
jgi:hypothetical protein